MLAPDGCMAGRVTWSWVVFSTGEMRQVDFKDVHVFSGSYALIQRIGSAFSLDIRSRFYAFIYNFSIAQIVG